MPLFAPAHPFFLCFRKLGSALTVTTAAILLFCHPALATSIVQDYRGTFGGNSVYGLNLSASHSNYYNYIITSTGADSSETSADKSFCTFGINTGASVFNSGDFSITVTSGASVTASVGFANVKIYGIRATGAGDLENTGAITIFATGGSVSTTDYADAYPFAVGLQATGSADIRNSGDITITGTAGTITSTGAANRSFAYADDSGIYGDSTGDIFNTGNIFVSATGGTVNLAGAAAYATARGIYSLKPGSVTNMGNISVFATGGTAAGITADAYAYGIQLSADTDLIQTGMITASAATRAYEVYVASGTTTLKNRYNMTLDGDGSAGSILVDNGASLNLNAATLTLSSAGGFQWDHPYTLFDTAGTGTVTGSFTAAKAANANVVVAYNTQGTVSAADDTVSLTYDGNNAVSAFAPSTGLTASTLYQIDTVQNQHIATSFLARELTPPSPEKDAVLVADAGTVASDAPLGYFKPDRDWQFVFIPHHTILHAQDAPTGYNATLAGASIGLERERGFGKYGFLVGLTRTNVDYSGLNMQGNSETQDLFAAGLFASGAYNRWAFRLRMAGFLADCHYQGRTGLDLKMPETADYKTFGTEASLMGGYLFKTARTVIMPEAGLRHLWSHRQGFITSTADAAWNLACDGVDTQAFSAVADIRWMTRLDADGVILTPSAAFGFRQLLSDNEISFRETMPGNDPFMVSHIQNDLSTVLSASLNIDPGGGIITELSYAGEFGEETDRHSIWAKVTLPF